MTLDPTIRDFPEDLCFGIFDKVLRSLKIFTALIEYFVFGLKGHSQLVHMRIRYHFLADLHITLHHKIRVAIIGSTGRRDSHVRVLA